MNRSTLSKKTILIVDDEPDLRSVLLWSLQQSGYNRLLEAESGDQAYELIKAQHVDLILSDVRMPKGDGIELLEKIQKYTYKPIVILITGDTQVAEADALMKGAYAILEKPINKRKMLDTIASALEGISQRS